MRLLIKNVVCLSLVLSIISACSSSNSETSSRFYAKNRTKTTDYNFISDDDLEKVVNQSFRKSQQSKNNLTENQKWDAGKTMKVNKSKKTEQKNDNTFVNPQLKKSNWSENSQQAQQNSSNRAVVYSVSTKTAYLPNQSSGYSEQKQVQQPKITQTQQSNVVQPVVGKYYIQAGCYSHEDVALSQAAKLKANGINDVSIVNEGGVSKVRVGPFDSKEAGSNVLNKMKNQLGFVDSFWKY